MERLTVDRALRSVSETAKSVTRLDGRLLLMHCLHCRLEDVIAAPDRALTDEEAGRFHALIERRIKGEPVSQILQHKEFWGLPFKVTRDVLTPRPDTETLIELALELYEKEAPETILDIGTGSGCILAALLQEFSHAAGTGIDISELALTIAAENIRNLGFSKRACLEQADFRSDLTGRYDLIVSNPPYISKRECSDLPVDVRDYEPATALFAGDGYDAYRAIVVQLPRLLRPDGIIIFEVGQGQLDTVISLITKTFEQAGRPLGVTVKNDLSGIPRSIGARG